MFLAAANVQVTSFSAHEIMFSYSLESRQGPMDRVWIPDASGSMPDLTIDSDKLAAVGPFLFA